MRVITYRIELLEPTLVTALQGDPNEGVAFDYIPGSALRGAIIKKYLRSNNLTEPDAADPRLRQLFFDGTTRYLNGYPLDRLGKRTLPTPLSWQHEKGNERDISDFAVELPDANDDKQWQGVGKPFCSLGEPEDGGRQKVRLVRPDRHIAVHTARTRRFGRAMPANVIDPSKGDVPGAVYRYDALAAGQTFEAIVICNNDTGADEICPLLSEEVTLGGSRSGGYGRASLEVVREETAETWREVSVPLTAEVDGKIIITFLSDALIRDDNGQFSVDPHVVRGALSQRLGVPLRLQRAFLRGETIGGFNRKWGLPLAQALAVRMGSVFVFDKPDCDESKLRQLETEGIGERRAEGFGRVGINWHTEAELEVDLTLPSRTIPAVPIPPGSESERLLRQMAERMLRRRLDERLIARANEIKIVNPPSNAQISRLRNILHDELMKETPSTQRVREFLSSVRERNTARRQFERARVGTKTLLNWLEETLQAIAWTTWFGFQSADAPRVGGVQASLTDTLRTEYFLRLVDAVLARAAKELRKEAK
ncbi:CRISPR-associated RAMP protein Csx10 [Candidatus Parcubacteria bacterium]|nr:MAG: CRISPR-associated RAMP protein Csx10 [Candidatus Parcubacteria bacterium]